MSTFLGLSSSPFNSRAPTPVDATRNVQSQKDQSQLQLQNLYELGLLQSSDKKSKGRDRDRDLGSSKPRESQPYRGGSVAESQSKKGMSSPHTLFLP